MGDVGFVDGARQIAEQTDDRAGGFDALKLAVSAKNEPRQAATVGLKQATGLVIEIGEVRCHVPVFFSILAWTGVLSRERGLLEIFPLRRGTGCQQVARDGEKPPARRK